jgi:Nickel/cobalt transporter regulator
MRNFALAILLTVGVSVPAMASDEGDRERGPVQISDQGHRGGDGNWGGGGRRWRGEGQQMQPQVHAEQRPAPEVQPQPQRGFGGDGSGGRWNRGNRDGERGGEFQRRGFPQAQQVPQAAPQAPGVPQQADRDWNNRRGYEVRGTDDIRGGIGNRGFRRQGGELNTSAVPVPRQDDTQRRWNRDGNRANEGPRRDDRTFSDSRRSDRDRSDGDGPRYGAVRSSDDWRNGHRDDNRRYSYGSRNDHYGYSKRWNHDWRGDNRYDWRSYRSNNRHYYRQPTYYNPYGYGYGYSRLSIGIFANSRFYANRYWINDPSHYRLPPAYGPYRWVRYYDDALLIDLETGEVVDAIYSFFY